MGKLTITNTINLTACEYSRCKPFFEAVQAGRWETAKDFCIQHPDAVRVRHPSSGKTALHIAVEAGHVDIVRKLVLLTGFDYSRCKPFFEAVQAGRWETAEDFYIQHPDAVRARHPSSGKTALHIAVEAGHVDIVRKLVSLMEEDDLEIKSTEGDWTALAIAASEGITEMAKCMVTRNEKLLSIPDAFDKIPLEVACLYGHWHVARYLYSVTPLEDLMPDKGPRGATIISNCFPSKEFDIAWDLINHCPKLAFTSSGEDATPLENLARMASAFRSGVELNLSLWKIFVNFQLRSTQARLHRQLRPHHTHRRHPNSALRLPAAPIHGVWKEDGKRIMEI